MRILVLGASGRLGRHVVSGLLDRGHSVRAFIHNENVLDDHAELERMSRRGCNLATVSARLLRSASRSRRRVGAVMTRMSSSASATPAASQMPSKRRDELKQLHAAGVRGFRFNIATPGGGVTMDMLEPLAKRIAPLGWHVQFWMTADTLLAAKDMLYRLPVPAVFDHLAHIPQPAGVDHPAFAVVADLLQKGKVWVKLSGAYHDTKVGPPTYADTISIAQAYVKAAPDQLVWGSDWPHPSEQRKPGSPLPDDAALFDLLAQWVPDETVRNRILVDNPARLYGFA
jgi:predicted TIM-barrel fold metal-dependent hydrolase